MQRSPFRLSARETPSVPRYERSALAPTLLPRRRFIGWLGVLAASLGLASGRATPGSRAAQEGELALAAANGGTVGIGCIGIFVRDLPASLNFYRRLGLAIPPNAGAGSDFRLLLPNGQVFFWETAAAVRAFDPKWRPPSGQVATGQASAGYRRMVLEFGFATPQALDRKYAELVAAGAEGYLAPFTFQGSNIRIALVRDPDGNETGLRFPKT